MAYLTHGLLITYDANGNMTSDGTKTYVWDARDRLVQIKTGATVNASFAYDVLGRRSTCTVGSAVTKFLYDGLNPIQEQSASNAATANLLTGLGVDGFISRTTVSDGLTVHFLPDALNSTLALTDASGVVSTSYTYEPFGKATKTGAATTNTYGFTGREDDGTGLMYYRARYYNPTFSRFISEDPIGLSGGINNYGYVGDNPVQLTDPTGKIIPLLIGVGVVAGDIGIASAFGAAANGFVNGFSYVASGKSYWDGFKEGLVPGAVDGAVSLVNPLAGAAVAGAWTNNKNFHNGAGVTSNAIADTLIGGGAGVLSVAGVKYFFGDLKGYSEGTLYYVGIAGNTLITNAINILGGAVNFFRGIPGVPWARNPGGTQCPI